MADITADGQDLASANIASLVHSYKLSSRTLLLQAKKIDSVMGLFNHCSDDCNLQFKESGLKDEGEDTQCFKTCIVDSQKILN